MLDWSQIQGHGQRRAFRCRSSAPSPGGVVDAVASMPTSAEGDWFEFRNARFFNLTRGKGNGEYAKFDEKSMSKGRVEPNARHIYPRRRLTAINITILRSR